VTRNRFDLVAVAGYCLLMTVYVYAWVHQPEPDYSKEPENAVDVLVPIGALVLHLVTGFAIGRWWALALALFPVVVAIPAGDYPGGWPELPVAFTMASEELMFGLPALAIGVAARRLLARRKGSRASQLA
jgi:hypothetical protein